MAAFLSKDIAHKSDTFYSSTMGSLHKLKKNNKQPQQSQIIIEIAAKWINFTICNLQNNTKLDLTAWIQSYKWLFKHKR